MWVLQNILPKPYRVAADIGPGPDPPEDVPDVEAAYIGLYTTVIALIAISGGSLPESKLDRQLTRMNAEQSTPVDSTEKTIARMIKEGYVVKIKDTSSGEEVVEYVVGPRGRVEVDKHSLADFVRAVYGDGVENLEQKIARSFGLSEEDEAQSGEAAAERDVGRGPGRPRRRNRDDDDDDDDDD
jgi:hypothetical protein